MPVPDPEITARNWALSKPSITGLVGTRVATRLPAEPTFPFLTVFRVGGTFNPSEAPIDSAFLQWDAYGAKGNRAPDYASAAALAYTLVEEADLEPGVAVTNPGVDGYVYMFELNDIRRVEEPVTGWARYTVDMNMILRGA